MVQVSSQMPYHTSNAGEATLDGRGQDKRKIPSREYPTITSASHDHKLEQRNAIEAFKVFIDMQEDFAVRPNQLYGLGCSVIETVQSALRGTYALRFQEAIEECTLELLMAPPDSLSTRDRCGVVYLLLELAYGYFPGVDDLWRKARHQEPNGTTNSEGVFISIIKELIPRVEDLAMDDIYAYKQVFWRLFCRWPKRSDFKWLDISNKILSLLIAYSTGFDQFLSWHLTFNSENPPTCLFGKCREVSINERTLAILEGIGIDRRAVEYWIFRQDVHQQSRMNYHEHLREVYGISVQSLTALNWGLIWLCGRSWGSLPCFEAIRMQDVDTELLIRRGADVNFVVTNRAEFPYFKEEDQQPLTPLGAAVIYNQWDRVDLLLRNGADVLLDSERCLLSKAAEIKGYLELTAMLEELKQEERRKRNLPQPTGYVVPNLITPPPSTTTIRRICHEKQNGLRDHAVLVLGLFLTAVEALRRLFVAVVEVLSHVFVCALGWCLRNQLALRWIFGWGCYYVRAVVQEFGWALFGGFLEWFYS
ncbi:hypothetical protein K440DRAFT_644321 [Wilcoxina mikolae CBS 423.85]|nr:hypothetical protein K440DRAFT_644321 [Wilcoxina mikolae CBS 423.85]